MIAAYELALVGIEVVLINPTPVWGGHFSSKTINGVPFDLGMVGFEFTGFHNEPTDDLSMYDARQRNNIARFCHKSQAYVETLIAVHRARAPLMLWNGRLCADVLMANELSILKELDDNVSRQIRIEIEEILARPELPLHAARKVDNPIYLSSTYEQASLENHGKTFHELFIEPFADRLFPGGAGRFAALYHRCLWMPLYYPETMLAAMGPNPHDLETLFHYPSEGRIGALAEGLLQRIHASGKVRIVRTAVSGVSVNGAVSVTVADGAIVEGSSLIWGLDLAYLLRSTGVGEERHQNHKQSKTSAVFGFFTVDRSRLKPDFSSLFVIDPKRMIYRITNLSDSGGTDEINARLVLECDSHYFAGDDGGASAIVDQAAKELIELGLIPDRSAIVSADGYAIPNIMPIPNKTDHDVFWESHDLSTGRMPSVHLIGPSSGYLITTMNDQVIQGLRAAAFART
jgi:hypothetical protein